MTVAACVCGCGETLAPSRWRKRGVRFIRGHNSRGRSVSERFWEKVDKSPGQGPQGECWTWAGSRDPFGYGRLLVDGSGLLAHRIGYGLQVGPIPPGHELCHSCDNPPCVRGAHLSPASHAVNMAQCRDRGRGRGGCGRMSNETRAEIRRLRAEGMTHKKIEALTRVSSTSVRRVLREEHRP